MLPRPWRPSKLRLVVEAQRSPGARTSSFIARHIEQPGWRHSKRVDQDLRNAFALRLVADHAGTRNDHGANRCRDLASPHHSRSRSQIFNARVRARANEHAIDWRALDACAGRQRDVVECLARGCRVDAGCRVDLGNVPVDGNRLVWTRAPRNIRRDLRCIDMMFDIEESIGVRAQRAPCGRRAIERRRIQIAHAGPHVVDRRVVRCNQRSARAGFDRHVAQGHSRLGRKRSDRRSRIFEREAAGALCADTGNDVQYQVLRRGARRQFAVDGDPHVVRHAIDERLRREYVFDFGGADPEPECAERAVSRRVTIATQYDHARPDQSDFRCDDVLDPLRRIVHVEQVDALRDAVAGEIRGLPGCIDNVDRAGGNRHRTRRDDVVDNAHLLPWPAHEEVFLNESGERLRTRVLVHDMQVRIQQHMLLVEAVDSM